MAGHAVPGLCLPLWHEGQAVTRTSPAVAVLPPSEDSACKSGRFAVHQGR